jgi:hypothetical protein
MYYNEKKVLTAVMVNNSTIINNGTAGRVKLLNEIPTLH